MYVVDFKYHRHWNYKNKNQLILTKHIAIENLSNYLYYFDNKIILCSYVYTM